MILATDQILLNAILANPHDDLPRLVYADCIEEAGHLERAEFIRLQIELVRQRGPAADSLPLQTREKILLDRYGKQWLAPLRARGEALQNPGTHGLFRRGFVEIVWMPAGIFNWKAHRLFKLAPVLELRVTRLTHPELLELLETPETPKLEVLDLSGNRLNVLHLIALRQAKHLSQLKRLRLRRCLIDSHAAEVLIESLPTWPNLVELDLTHNPIAADILTQLRHAYGARLIAGELASANWS